jgi:predicted nucleic acid-binding protein
VITLDTAGLLAALNRRDVNHKRAASVLARERGALLVPASALSEMAYMIQRWLSDDLLRAFVADIARGYYSVDCGERDFDRIGELLERYDDLRLDFADASVIACAERNGGRVLTLDTRHFVPVAREGAITILPAPG